jgi:hypothetical protein
MLEVYQEAGSQVKETVVTTIQQTTDFVVTTMQQTTTNDIIRIKVGADAENPDWTAEKEQRAKELEERTKAFVIEAIRNKSSEALLLTTVDGDARNTEKAVECFYEGSFFNRSRQSTPVATPRVSRQSTPVSTPRVSRKSSRQPTPDTSPDVTPGSSPVQGRRATGAGETTVSNQDIYQDDASYLNSSNFSSI